MTKKDSVLYMFTKALRYQQPGAYVDRTLDKDVWEVHSRLGRLLWRDLEQLERFFNIIAVATDAEGLVLTMEATAYTYPAEEVDEDKEENAVFSGKAPFFGENEIEDIFSDDAPFYDEDDTEPSKASAQKSKSRKRAGRRKKTTPDQDGHVDFTPTKDLPW